MFPESFRFFPHPSPPGSALIRKRTVGEPSKEQKLPFQGKAARRGAEPAAGWRALRVGRSATPNLRGKACGSGAAMQSPPAALRRGLGQCSIRAALPAFLALSAWGGPPHGNKDRPRRHAAALKTGSSPPTACCTAHPRRCRVHRIPRRSWRCSYRMTNRN